MFKKILPFALLCLLALSASLPARANPVCSFWTPQFGCVLWLPQLLPNARWCTTVDEAPGPTEIALYSNPSFNASPTWAYCQIVDLTPGQPYQVLDLQEFNWSSPQFYIQSIRIGSRTFVTLYDYFQLTGTTEGLSFGASLTQVPWTVGSISASAINLPTILPFPRRF